MGREQQAENTGQFPVGSVVSRAEVKLSWTQWGRDSETCPVENACRPGRCRPPWACVRFSISVLLGRLPCSPLTSCVTPSASPPYCSETPGITTLEMCSLKKKFSAHLLLPSRPNPRGKHCVSYEMLGTGPKTKTRFIHSVSVRQGNKAVDKTRGQNTRPCLVGPDTQQVGVREFMYNAESPSRCLFWGPKLSCLQSPGRQYT